MKNNNEQNDPLESVPVKPKMSEKDIEWHTKFFAQQYAAGFFMEEWTTRQGVPAYRWTKSPTGRVCRISTIEGTDYNIYERPMA